MHLVLRPLMVWVVEGLVVRSELDGVVGESKHTDPSGF